MGYKIVVLCCLFVLTLVHHASGDNGVWNSIVATFQAENKRDNILFRVEGPNGPKTIKTYPEAVKACQDAGGVITHSWRLRDAVRLKHYDRCGGCGWMLKSGKWFKNFRPICGNAEEEEKVYYKPCADNPADEGLEGYDAYCWGKGSVNIPPDAVPVNVGRERGYIFVAKNGENQVIPTRSLASTICNMREAKLATSKQVELAWYNGFSECRCGWMVNYQGMPMKENILSCGNSASYMGCHYGDLLHAYCFMDARHVPFGSNLVNFGELPDNTYPMGIEKGAVQIDGGYVYPTLGLQGPNETPTIFKAYTTCKDQGATVATPDQMREAISKGFNECGCGWVWENAELKWGVMVTGSGAVYKACGSLESCPLKNPTADGWDVFCYKDCPRQCPPPKNWNIPYRSVKITGGRVFHVESKDGKYKLNSQSDAEAECKKNKAELATMEQLKKAQYSGMTQCRCGYLADGKVAFPMYRAISGCGGDVGVYECPGKYPDIPESGPSWDAYCFISDSLLNSLTTYDLSLSSKRTKISISLAKPEDPEHPIPNREELMKGQAKIREQLEKERKERQRQKALEKKQRMAMWAKERERKIKAAKARRAQLAREKAERIAKRKREQKAKEARWARERAARKARLARQRKAKRSG